MANTIKKEYSYTLDGTKYLAKISKGFNEEDYVIDIYFDGRDKPTDTIYVDSYTISNSHNETVVEGEIKGVDFYEKYGLNIAYIDGGEDKVTEESIFEVPSDKHLSAFILWATQFQDMVTDIDAFKEYNFDDGFTVEG